MSSYFSSLSFARAKKNQEDLQKTNPTEPVLNDEDEKFLTRVTSSEAQAPEAAKDVAATQITDDGEEKEVPKEKLDAEGVGADQVAVPATQPEESVEDPPEEAPKEEDKAEPVAAAEKAKKSKKDRGFDLPSQEEAEAATRGFNAQSAMPTQDDSKQSQQGEKRTWASYLPSIPTKTTKDGSQQDNEKSDASPAEGKDTRTWTQYATSYMPSAPSLPTSWTRSRDKDATASPVYKEDGSIDEAATKEKQEREVSVLLDNLSLSSINNRVFSFSAESQKFYDRFTQVLKDTLNGAPTAYEDMDKLMKDAGPTLERNFKSMPPFVQTLVKSLPAKLGTTLGPEILAASSEKPGSDMQKRMAAAEKSKASGGDPSIQAQDTGAKEGQQQQQKKKRKIPGLKSLMSGEGMVASMLRNVVNFLQVRFPFLASTTNVVLSLAVFILMFVFWYCHKRGKEVRLEREGAATTSSAAADGTAEDEDGDDDDIEVTDEDDEENGAAEAVAEKIASDVKGATGEAQQKGEGEDKGEGKARDDLLNQPEPSEVPLPDAGKGGESA